jgi:transcription elongation factor GreA
MSKEMQFTQEGLDRLKSELDELKGPVRRRIADAIREAKAHGDLRENAAYHEAKLNQTRLESRIADLEKAVQLARVVERPQGDSESAQLGSRVTLRDLEFDDELTVKLVGAFEADPSKDLISISSPLGEAILGSTVGNRISVEAPAGVTEYEILKIE